MGEVRFEDRPEDGQGGRIVPMRLQKFLARAGVASRRSSENLMTAGRVRVNGQVVTELGSKVDPLVDVVTVDGVEVKGTLTAARTVAAKPDPTPTSVPAPTEAPRTSLSGCKIAVKPQVYSGRAKTPAVKVTLDGQTLSRGVDYTVEYSDNVAIGRAAVTVTGVGRYTGVATASFRINPKAVAGLKLTPGKGLINASWKRAPGGVTGYQLQYALKQSFRGAKQASVPKAATVKKALKGLKKGKTYFVRIRAYKKAGKATYYSAWSPAKKAKVR